MDFIGLLRSGARELRSALSNLHFSENKEDLAFAGSAFPSTTPSSGDSAPRESRPLHRIISGKFLSRVAIRPLQLVQEELANENREYEALNTEYVSKRDNLLAIETDVRDELARRYNPLLNEIAVRRGKLQTELDQRQLNTQYPLVNLEFLRQVKQGRHGLKLPKYALFDAAHSTVQVWGQAYKPDYEHSSKFHYYVSPDIARGLLDFSQLNEFGRDYIAKYKEEDMLFVTVSVAAQFTHILPTDVRRFFKADASAYDEVFFVTEAPDWIATLNDKGLPINVSSKKISVIARKDKTCWLIAETEAL